MDDSTARMAESPAAKEAGKKFPVAGAGEWLGWFSVMHLLMLLYFSDKQAEGQPKSPGLPPMLIWYR